MGDTAFVGYPGCLYNQLKQFRFIHFENIYKEKMQLELTHSPKSFPLFFEPDFLYK